MITTDLLQQCLLDQREECENINYSTLIKRKEMERIELDSNLAQVITGVRRSGKSTLCHMALRAENKNYAYVNFDDDRLATLNVDDLSMLLSVIYQIYGSDITYLFFDEIQNVDGWHLFVSRLLRQGHRIIITGSNAKLLNSELTTHLTGRFHEIKLYPFSFREYCLQRNIPTDELVTTRVEASQLTALKDYLLQGGFPEIEYIRDRKEYLNGLISTIVSKDIQIRFRINNPQGLKTLAYYLLDNIGQFVNLQVISQELGVGTEKTVRNYIEYLTQGYLILTLKKFSFKSRERLRNEKSYAVDTGLVTFHASSLAPDNLGWRLENVVFMELLRRSTSDLTDIYYYRATSRSREVDFVVTDRGKPQVLIQVSYDVSNPKTLKREITALVEASSKLNCDNLILITNNQDEVIELDGRKIRIISARSWLLKKRTADQ